MAGNILKIKEASLSALNLFRAGAFIYNQTGSHFITYYKVKYTYGQEIFTGEAELDVQLNTGKIKLHGIHALQSDKLRMIFGTSADRYSFDNETFKIKGTYKGVQLTVEFLEYAKNSLLIPR